MEAGNGLGRRKMAGFGVYNIDAGTGFIGDNQRSVQAKAGQ